MSVQDGLNLTSLGYILITFKATHLFKFFSALRCDTTSYSQFDWKGVGHDLATKQQLLYTNYFNLLGSF